MKKPIEQIHEEAWAALHREYRHLEMMAATIVPGLLAKYPRTEDSTIAKWSVEVARAIQEEVRREG